MSPWRALSAPAFVVSLALLGGSALALNAGVRALKYHLSKMPIEVDRKVQAVPTQTASWQRVGEDRRESEEMIEQLNTRNYLSRAYAQKSPPKGKEPVVLDLHLAYYTGMVDTVPHVPERCLVAGGWQYVTGPFLEGLALEQPGAPWIGDDAGPADAGASLFKVWAPDDLSPPGRWVRLPRNPRSIRLRVSEFGEPRSGRKMFAGYFFIANGGVADSAEDIRLLAFKLTDDYAYYLKVQVASAQVRSSRELADAAQSLLGELLPDLMQCVPDWVEVERGTYPPDNPTRPRRAGAPATRTAP